MKTLRHSTSRHHQSYLRRKRHVAVSGLRSGFLGFSFLEMTRLFAAQILNCEHEAGKHAVNALRLGESQERISALANWDQSANFRFKERAALSFVDALLRAKTESDFERAVNKAVIVLDRSDVLEVLFSTLSIADWKHLADLG